MATIQRTYMAPWLKRSSYLIDNITKKKLKKKKTKKNKNKNKNLMTNESCRNVDIYLEDVFENEFI